MKEKNCLRCGKKFSPKWKISTRLWEKVKYCSRKCYYTTPKESHKIEKSCVICKKTYWCWPYRKDSKCCSEVCVDLYRRTSEFKDNLSKKHKGKVISEETKRLLSESLKGRFKGKASWNWRGNNVGYRAIHDWVIRQKGKPNKCEHCGMGTADKIRLVWANKSHKYLRETDDWLRLCYRCHRKYDFPNEKHR